MTDIKLSKLSKTLGIKGFWDNLNHNHKRLIAVILIVFFLVLFLAILVGDEQALNISNTSSERHILLNTDTRSLGIDALNAKVNEIVKNNHAITSDIERIMRDIKEINKRRGNAPDISKKITTLESRLSTIMDKTKTIGWQVEDIKDGYYDIPHSTQQVISDPVSTADKANTYQSEKILNVVEKGMNKDPNYYFQANKYINEQVGKANGPTTDSLSIYTNHNQKQNKKEPSTDTITHTLPSGTILHGVLLNGVDAPTGQNAQKEPHPVLVRIQKDAILPNHYTSDIKECFALLSGYGELSSERTYLRGERLSCIKNDKEVIDIKFPAYAIGEDGKVGIRGRLVTRTGALLAKTAVSGFMSGLASVFTDKPVPVIQTGNVDQNRLFQENLSRDAFKSGIGSGATEAFSNLADYYLSMAEEIFPIIEVDIGRKVDIILTNPVKIISNS
ncbi:MAG: TraB/VirB10 family protein [Candidatus Thiodiazotropha endolucinida]|nr:TraB/VirB10 family protein [Candidatus Thiodiazotropha taylori]MCW4225207.1 TraB/VirB10 family protein [Candidatus Thiodiazotropha endolucinida]MCG7880759.1 TraB/VirB10 family protein [Candidatus Thiodiazotropha taylori]MCG7886778.1 TraB/VirB10 family protein [Candidatus Thiodiazotropha taylori]MCG8028166.1 TraB/VirB10 family protein [Candidatus Thiodiazotropha taylori]